MKVEGIRLDGLGPQSQAGSRVVEAFAVGGELPDLFPGQRLAATVLTVNGQDAIINLKGVQVTLASFPGLKAGSELFVRVARVAPKLVLEIASRPTQVSLQLPPLAI